MPSILSRDQSAHPSVVDSRRTASMCTRHSTSWQLSAVKLCLFANKILLSPRWKLKARNLLVLYRHARETPLIDHLIYVSTGITQTWVAIPLLIMRRAIDAENYINPARLLPLGLFLRTTSPELYFNWNTAHWMATSTPPLRIVRRVIGADNYINTAKLTTVPVPSYLLKV